MFTDLFHFYKTANSFDRRLAACCLLFFAITVHASLHITDELLARIEQKYDTQAKQRVMEWEKMIDSNKKKSDQQQMQAVNQFFNQNILFINDIVHWGIVDYWATPLEFLASGGGDCEDFSIAKYFTLIELGISEDKLRLTYVKAIDLNQAHMVLTYFSNPRAIPLVLDNLIQEIKPATMRKDLVPVYSFNGTGLWLAKARGSGKRVGSSKRLNLWEALKNKMRNDEI